MGHGAAANSHTGSMESHYGRGRRGSATRLLPCNNNNNDYNSAGRRGAVRLLPEPTASGAGRRRCVRRARRPDKLRQGDESATGLTRPLSLDERSDNNGKRRRRPTAHINGHQPGSHTRAHTHTHNQGYGTTVSIASLTLARMCRAEIITCTQTHITCLSGSVLARLA